MNLPLITFLVAAIIPIFFGKIRSAPFWLTAQAAALAWPANRPAVDSLRYEPGKLTLSAAGWSPDEIDQFRARLRPAGWAVESLEGRLVLTRGASANGS